MTCLVSNHSAIKLTPLNIPVLKQDNFCAVEVFQQIFSSTYLQPFDRDPQLVLKDKEFEVIDASICRVTHGAMHASRVAAYVKVLHVFRSNLFPQDSKALEPLLCALPFDTTQLIHLTQIVGCLHDAARRAEVADRWDKESGELCLASLQELFVNLEQSLLVCFSKMIEYKDDPQRYTEFLRSLDYPKDQITSWNYLRELIHDADCLDIMRVRKTFDVKFLDLLKNIKHPAQSSSLIELIIQIRDLIQYQGDQYKDLTIHHPFPSETPLFSKKNFSIETKATYEHAPLVYAKILEDMERFSWLKAVSSSLSLPSSSYAAKPTLYPQKKLSSLFEDLTVFKKNDCRIFHGGPVDNSHGIHWVMPVCFMDPQGNVRSAYELCFIYCQPSFPDLKDVPLYQVSISDLDLKTRNTALESVKFFFDLINSPAEKKAILLRETDILNISYPHIYNLYLYSEKKPADTEDILSFLKENCGVRSSPQAIGLHNDFFEKHTVALSGIVERRKIDLSLAGESYPFFAEHHVNSQDPWGSFYVFSLASFSKEAALPISLRLDSGCNSGMAYLDTRCSCLTELEEGLLGLVKDKSKDSVLIHIPAHDGRGMGMAPKAETEIYKRGGEGKLHSIGPLKDIDAAKLLFETDLIDIRTFDGPVDWLKKRGINQVRLISRSLSKKQALENAGINVITLV